MGRFILVQYISALPSKF